MLTEDEYLAIGERVQRFSLGDPNVYADGDVLLVDLIRLLTDWREWERRLQRDLQRQPGTPRASGADGADATG